MVFIESAFSILKFFLASRSCTHMQTLFIMTRTSLDLSQDLSFPINDDSTVMAGAPLS